MKCKKHPEYKAIRKPIANCQTCRRIFALAQKRKLQQAHEMILEYRKTLFAIKRSKNKKEKIMKYMYSGETGEITEIKEKPKYNCALFLWKKGEKRQYDGSAPLLFKNRKEAERDIANDPKTVKSWKEKGLEIDIQDMEIYE